MLGLEVDADIIDFAFVASDGQSLTSDYEQSDEELETLSLSASISNWAIHSTIGHTSYFPFWPSKGC